MWSAREALRGRRPGRRRAIAWTLLAACAAQAAVASAGELRDPFVFGPRREVTDETPASDQPGLTGIIWDAASPLAVIGGELFTVGQIVEGWRIAEIKEDHIVLERDGERQELVSGDPLPAE